MHNLIEAPLALLAGVFTIASPCVLPILPILLGTAVAQSSRVRPLFIVAGFVLTFAALGMLLGVVSSRIELAHEALRNVGIAMLALSGLFQLWPRPYRWLMARVDGPLQRLGAGGGNAGPGKAGGFLLGMSLGAVWTPCAGPVLASILALVARAQDVSWSALLLLLYAVGAGIPMLVIAYGGQFMRGRVRQLARHTGRLQQFFGLLVLLSACAIYFQYDVLAYAWLADVSSTLKGL
ncbi:MULTISPECIES: cytochrome c biogenesis CcdA family protein [unclassified Janthinobacterium]|uniref:cytochrome c biogenesis CcdA family protein n=1 Tax=unclassified Janthinobacterium TaxID=2610881 RepID=UPI0003468631|nr:MULTISPECIES: cytochrome c biogenesis CcdA family protein [unclassified Janthinobacterium]MEC5162845.1 cytochrome c-type biogenesis protein [Janthinobacterium sp. CG_S6]